MMARYSGSAAMQARRFSSAVTLVHTSCCSFRALFVTTISRVKGGP